MKNVILLFAILLLSSSCVDRVEIDTSIERRVVLNCLLADEGIQTLTLNYSSPIGEKYYEEVENAKITLFEQDSVVVGKFKKTGYSQWSMRYRPKVGSRYKLHVEIDGRPLITATTTMPKKLTIHKAKDLDVSNKKHFIKEGGGISWAFAFQKTTDTVMRRIIIKREYSLLPELGTNYPMADPFNIMGKASTVNLDGKAYFAYLRMREDYRRNPFFLQGHLYCSIVVFRSVSNEYDLYLKSSIQKMMHYISFYDPSQWLDEDGIYTNVENGTGIFGAYADVLFNYNISPPD